MQVRDGVSAQVDVAVPGTGSVSVLVSDGVCGGLSAGVVDGVKVLERVGVAVDVAVSMRERLWEAICGRESDAEEVMPRVPEVGEPEREAVALGEADSVAEWVGVGAALATCDGVGVAESDGVAGGLARGDAERVCMTQVVVQEPEPVPLVAAVATHVAVPLHERLVPHVPGRVSVPECDRVSEGGAGTDVETDRLRVGVF